MATRTISQQINSIAFKAAVILLIGTIPAFLLPLEAPTPTQEDSAQWLMNDLNGYMMGWILQIILMMACTGVFVGAAWQIYSTNPVRSVLVWSLAALSFVVFIIAKFIMVWAVPLMARSLAAGSAERDTAEAFLTAANPSVSFGLVPTLDYLGFLVYGIISIMLFRPLLRLSASAKVAAVSLLIYGVCTCLALGAAVTAIISQGDTALYVESPAVFFLVAVIALLVRFNGQRKPASGSVSK
jgi:hypothetical protein